jgi:hypothetical protein
LIWTDGDRAKAISQLATDNSLDVYFNAQGLAVVQPLPVLTPNSAAVWTVDASASGVMIDATRQTDLSSVHNAVIVSSSASDIILTPVEVKNTNSPVVDPLSTLGPPGDKGTPRPVDHQMLESTVIPLTPDATQTGTLRSTRAADGTS